MEKGRQRCDYGDVTSGGGTALSDCYVGLVCRWCSCLAGAPVVCRWCSCLAGAPVVCRWCSCLAAVADCYVGLVSRWCSCLAGAPVVCRWCSCLAGAPVVCRWCPCGVSLVPLWCLAGAPVVCRWCSCGVSMVLLSRCSELSVLAIANHPANGAERKTENRETRTKRNVCCITSQGLPMVWGWAGERGADIGIYL